MAKKIKDLDVTIEKAEEVLIKAPKKKAFFVEVETCGQVFSADTDAIADYILSIKAPLHKTQTVIRVTHEGLTREKVFNVAFARKLFSNPITALVFEKNIRLALNAK